MQRERVPYAIILRVLAPGPQYRDPGRVPREVLLCQSVQPLLQPGAHQAGIRRLELQPGMCVGDQLRPVESRVPGHSQANGPALFCLPTVGVASPQMERVWDGSSAVNEVARSQSTREVQGCDQHCQS